MGNSVLIALGCLSGVDQRYWPLAFGQLQTLDCLYLMTNTSSLSAATADDIRSIESAPAFFTVTYLSPNHIFMLYILRACTLKAQNTWHPTCSPSLSLRAPLDVRVKRLQLVCCIRNIIILTSFFLLINHLKVSCDFAWSAVWFSSADVLCAFGFVSYFTSLLLLRLSHVNAPAHPLAPPVSLRSFTFAPPLHSCDSCHGLGDLGFLHCTHHNCL